MEGAILESGALTFASAYGALVVLGFVFAGFLLGSIADRERNGETIHWSSEPIPGAGEPEERRESETRRAA